LIHTRAGRCASIYLANQAITEHPAPIASAVPHLKNGFLSVLARVFADHQDFWNDTKRTVSSDLHRKAVLFPINDPTISRLCGAFGQAQVAFTTRSSSTSTGVNAAVA
jgi:hypothetical protein